MTMEKSGPGGNKDEQEMPQDDRPGAAGMPVGEMPGGQMMMLADAGPEFRATREMPTGAMASAGGSAMSEMPIGMMSGKGLLGAMPDYAGVGHDAMPRGDMATATTPAGQAVSMAMSAIGLSQAEMPLGTMMGLDRGDRPEGSPTAIELGGSWRLVLSVASRSAGPPP